MRPPNRAHLFDAVCQELCVRRPHAVVPVTALLFYPTRRYRFTTRSRKCCAFRKTHERIYPLLV